MLEVNHIAFDESLLDLLTCPRNEELIIVVGLKLKTKTRNVNIFSFLLAKHGEIKQTPKLYLFCKTQREIDRIFQLHSTV